MQLTAASPCAADVMRGPPQGKALRHEEGRASLCLAPLSPQPNVCGVDYCGHRSAPLGIIAHGDESGDRCVNPPGAPVEVDSGDLDERVARVVFVPFGQGVGLMQNAISRYGRRTGSRRPVLTRRMRVWACGFAFVATKGISREHVHG